MTRKTGQIIERTGYQTENIVASTTCSSFTPIIDQMKVHNTKINVKTISFSPTWKYQS